MPEALSDASGVSDVEGNSEITGLELEMTASEALDADTVSGADGERQAINHDDAVKAISIPIIFWCPSFCNNDLKQ